MEIEYLLFASFADYMPENRQGQSCVMTLEEGSTVGILIEHLNLPENKPKMIFLNGIRAKEDMLLKNGDRVGIFPLVAGG